MNIVNYSLDNELIGARKLGTEWHRQLRSRLTKQFKTEINELTTKNLCNSEHFTNKLPHILKEKEFNLKNSNINKIFTSQWLDERKCIMGTKCNKLVILDTVTGKYSVQNPLKSHPNSRNIQNHCGIHSISINPSRTLLATGAEHVNDIGIYSLPSLEPVLVGFNAHKYWIFDIVWLDDDHVVTGAGDNRLALWTVNSDKKPTNLKSNRINSSSSLNTSLHTSPIDSSNKNKILNYLDVDGRVDRRYLKRPSPSTPPLGSRIPVRVNPFHTSSFNNNTLPSTSNQFFNFFNTNRPITSISSTSPSSSSSFYSLQPSAPPSISAPLHSINRYGFYNIENYLTNQTNRRTSLNSLLNLNRNELNNVNENDLNNDNMTEDEEDDDDDDDDEDDDDNDEANDQDNLLNSSETYFFSEENSNNVFNTDYYSVNNRHNMTNQFDFIDYNEITDDDDEVNDEEDNDDDDDDDEIINNYNDHDENDDFLDDNDNSHLKRRRLNYNGKFKNTNTFKYKTPTKVIKCKHSKRIRALAFNPKRNEIAAISMNAAFHYFDINRFEQKYTKKLSPLKENVCLTINSDYSIYAIGSASHVQLLDANNAKPITQPIFIKKDIGVRSLHFRNNIVSIGTGTGTVLFYDVKANKFLVKNEAVSSNIENYLNLQTNGGWILVNETYYENLSYVDNSHAIYSHSYDPTGTKLLTAGGPLTINLYGHYAGIWQ